MYLFCNVEIKPTANGFLCTLRNIARESRQKGARNFALMRGFVIQCQTAEQAPWKADYLILTLWHNDCVKVFERQYKTDN